MIEQVQAATNKAILDELHALIDCIQCDGSVSGLEEIHPESTLGSSLYVFLLTHSGGYPLEIGAVEPADEAAAFPSVSYSQEIGDETFYESEPGLTIRDYFAIHADTASVEGVSGKTIDSLSKFLGIHPGAYYVNNTHLPAANAKARYILADAMMKARKAN
jgi:hypothetical protein